MALPSSSTVVTNLTQTNISETIIINPPSAGSPSDLIYNLSVTNPLFPFVTPDFVSPPNAYHGGYDPIALGTLTFADTSSLVASNTVLDVVSDSATKGIMEFRPTDGNYYWDEVYTTPLGLYQFQNGPLSLGSLYKFTSTAPNVLNFSTEDPNIIPEVGNYLVVQRFFDINTFSNESTTDDLNNVIVYPLGESYQFKITGITPTTGASLPVANVTLAVAPTTFSISGATNATPIVVTTTTAHGYVSGQEVSISGVVGNLAANGTFYIIVTSTTQFQLFLDPATTIAAIGTGAYTSGGTVAIPSVLNQIVITTGTSLVNLVPHGLTSGDMVTTTSIGGITAANGTFIVNVLSLYTFQLLGLDGITPVIGTGSYTGGGLVNVLPLYQVQLDKSFTPIGLNAPTFSVATITTGSPAQVETSTPHNYSTGNKITILDSPSLLGLTMTGYVSGIGGTYYIAVIDATHFNLFTDIKLSNPVVSVGTYVSGGSVQEAPAKYVFALLNRNGVIPNQQLFTDTFSENEIHRKQLLGDPFNQINTLFFTGPTNFLNYGGAGYLGMQNLLSSVIETGTTPFILFNIQDDIQDRLYEADSTVEVHLPMVMLQGSTGGGLVLKNQGPVQTDTTGAGDYTGLYYLDSTTPSLRSYRFGWVFHDLRIIVIDDPELATALGYNSNRNYTLPVPTIGTTNAIQNPTSTNPLSIVSVTSGTPGLITTSAPHGFNAGDQVQIAGVQPTGLVPNGTYYIGSPTATTFQIYTAPGPSVPLPVGTGYSSGGTVYSNKLPYEYFVTYRLNGIHYNTAPYAAPVNFNFDVNGNVQLFIPQLSNLVDGLNFQGFEANTFEVIISKYQQDTVNPLQIDGNEYVTLAPARNHTWNSVAHDLSSGTIERRRLNLKDASGIQTDVTGHIIVLNVNDIELAGAFAPIAPIPISPSAGLLASTNIPYDLVDTGAGSAYALYESIYGVPIYYDSSVIVANSTLFAANGVWTLGFIKYQQESEQYRLTLTVPVPAASWNGTTNPSFEPGNSLMSSKLITEVAFLIADPTGPPGSVIANPYIYGKISPPLEKNNSTDLSIEISIDF